MMLQQVATGEPKLFRRLEARGTRQRRARIHETAIFQRTPRTRVAGYS